MKHFILFMCLWGLSVSGYAHETDSLGWAEADREMLSGNYEKACRLYKQIFEKVNVTYNEINSRKAEDLRKIYSIDELELANSVQANYLLRLCWIIGLGLIVVFVGCVWYIREQNKRIFRSRIQLCRAKMMAEESIRNKSLFLSNMSHEIKTPLNALSGFSEILTMPGIDETTRAQCNEVIQLNSELLLKLINDVVDLSCLDIANMKFRIQRCEVVAFCRSIIQTLSAIQQTQAEIRFETEFSSLELDTDPSRLQQLLINLLVNATKFTKAGTITLRLEKEGEGTALFSVSDTGCGIPAEKQGCIFERFEKLNEKVQGSGLGLSICRLIIQRLGGKIWVDPAYTAGARFVFTHPLRQEEKE